MKWQPTAVVTIVPEVELGPAVEAVVENYVPLLPMSDTTIPQGHIVDKKAKLENIRADKNGATHCEGLGYRLRLCSG